MSHNLPNGIPPQMNKLEDKGMPQTNYALNGLGSAHSSRDHSPSTVRLNQIPTSQLPPSRTNIPASQLPPSASQSGTIAQLTKNYSHLSVSNGNSKEVTPFSSPGPQKFSTSTPNLEPVKSISQTQDAVEPVKFSSTHFDKSSANTTNFIPTSAFEQQFIHSSTSQFTNVPLQVSDNNQKTKNNQQNLQDINKLNENRNNLVQNQTINLAQPELTTTNNTQFNQFNKKYVSTSSGQIKQETTTVSAAKPQFNQVSSQKPSHYVSQPGISQPNYGISPSHVPSSAVTQNANQPNIINTNMSQAKRSFQHHYSQPQMTAYNFPTQRMQQPQQQPSLLIQSQRNPTNFNSAPNVSKNPVDYSKNHAKQEFNSQPLLPPTLNQTQQAVPPVNNLQVNQPGSMPILSNQPGYMQVGNQSGLTKSATNQFGPMQTMTPQDSSISSASSYQYGMGSTNTILPPTNVPPVAQLNKSTLHGNRYPANPAQPNQKSYGDIQPNLNYQVPLQQNQMPNAYQLQQQQNQMSTSYQPQQQQQSQIPNAYQSQQQQFSKQQYTQGYQNQPSFNQSVTQTGFNKYWGNENYDLLQCPNILPMTKIEPPKASLGQEVFDSINCSPDIFRCTMTKVPENSSLLSKSRLPLGVLIHPFKDLYHLPVIQCNTIVRCRACRTYINPFVFFVDTKRWKCNICYRINELPEEFQYDPVSKTYGDPSRRPEVKSSTIEYIAPAEYMLRPPQPAVYLFLLDISRAAVESGYLHSFCNVLSSELNNLPGDARMQIGFLAYNSALHFYSLAEGLSQPHEMTVLDIDDVFLPCPDNLLVNLNDRIELITDLLAQLPTRYNNSYDNNSALGAALQVAHKLMSATGGRVTVFQAALPTVGPGALTSREDPSQRASSEVQHLNPANDFYKRLALECSGQQIAVDLFIINPQYVDLATISGISRFSGGCIYHFPLFKAERVLQCNNFERTFKRYLTRKIGFEAVMRIRCTRGLSIHTFHGNFFVRSTDLLSLPNVNPDSGFGMQVSIEENLSDLQTVCFQAALLYTSSKGERRIRVHTLCLPVASLLTDIINSADQQCIVGLLAKMAVDRSMQSSLADAREAFINVAIDILSSYKLVQGMSSGPTGLSAPQCLRLLPLYISALLKHVAFRTGTSTRLDDRIKAMCDMKSKPLTHLIQMIYPDLYPIHNLEEHSTTIINEDEEPVPMPPHLQLTARNLDSNGAYLMDTGDDMIIIIGSAVNSIFLNQVLGVPDYNSLTDNMYVLPVLENPYNQRLHTFINYLNDEKPFMASLQILRDNSPNRGIFLERLIEDRIETALSYHEFLQHLKTQVK